MTADKIQVDSDMTPLLCHVRVFSGKIVSGDKRGCPYGQPKCSEDSYLAVRDDFWLSWTTGQPLLRTLILSQNSDSDLKLSMEHNVWSSCSKRK